MGLKADNWIRRMAKEHNMIEPFVDGQVRDDVISYGLSSYGYDVRVTDEFKIFTNVHSAMVDPKHFVPESFIDYKGEVCVIPPNSFVLARTMEYFRIPRNVLTMCIGKSTYARCFRGDTRVALADGTTPTLEEMARRAEDGEHFWGYSVGPLGRIIMTKLEAPRYIGRDSLLEITLDNDEKIRCTPDHQFVTRDGRMVPAHDLHPDDALMPFDTSTWRGYTMVYQPLNGHLYPAHRLADEWNLRHAVYADEADTHRHHIDHQRRNNMPANIGRATSTASSEFAHLTTQESSKSVGYRNHKIKAIKPLPGDHDVFCLTVPEAGNFALASGVFVKNCGLIVNVTPFEPEWEGYVTLEISNTTPLPAKVYAFEGIAQVLFFEGDEACDTSYADRKGKYQKQQSIVLPRI